jgi:DNA-directed RNA polymerase specialized sigma subunit
MARVRSIFEPADSDKLEEDFAPAFTAWQTTPTPQTNAALMAAVQPVIDTAVFSYGGSNASPNLRSRARLMALQAMPTYAPAKGSLKTHLLSQLQGLRRYSAKEQNPIRVPEQLLLDRNRLQDVEATLEDKLGRPASDAEIADFTGFSPKRLRRIRSVYSGVNEGSFVDETGESYTPASSMPGQAAAAEAWADFVYGDLSDTDKLIMDATLGRNGRRVMSTAQLASKLGLSAGAISQRRARIQKLLDERTSLFGR